MQYNTSTVGCNTTSSAVQTWGESVMAQITVLQSFIAAQIGSPGTGQNYNDLIVSIARWNNEIITVRLHIFVNNISFFNSRMFWLTWQITAILARCKHPPHHLPQPFL